MMGSQSEMLRLVGEVTDRYVSLGAFFARLRAEFDDRPTTQLPLVAPAAAEPVAWSAVPPQPEREMPTLAVEAENPAADCGDGRGDEDDDRAEVTAPPQQRAGVWGRMTGRRR